MRLQNLCVDSTMDVSYRKKKLKGIKNVKAMIFRVCGPCFIDRIAMIHEKKVVIHDIKHSDGVNFFKNDDISDEIPLFRNLTLEDLGENDDLPKRMVVDTKDIEVIRELIARGKKLSWYSRNLSTCGNFPGLFKFEHLFLRPYAGARQVLLPDGVPRKIRTRRYKRNFTYPFEPDKHVFFSMRYYRFVLLEKLWEKIGFYPKKFGYYVDRYYLIKNRVILRKKGKINYYVKDKTDLTFTNMPTQAAILIVLSVTYMVWKKSNFAMIAKEKTAKKG